MKIKFTMDEFYPWPVELAPDYKYPCNEIELTEEEYAEWKKVQEDAHKWSARFEKEFKL